MRLSTLRHRKSECNRYSCTCQARASNRRYLVPVHSWCCQPVGLSWPELPPLLPRSGDGAVESWPPPPFWFCYVAPAPQSKPREGGCLLSPLLPPGLAMPHRSATLRASIGPQWNSCSHRGARPQRRRQHRGCHNCQAGASGQSRRPPSFEATLATPTPPRQRRCCWHRRRTQQPHRRSRQPTEARDSQVRNLREPMHRSPGPEGSNRIVFPSVVAPPPTCPSGATAQQGSRAQWCRTSDAQLSAQ
mmetsp:Transcript_132641/g.330840  ORF Transcript_132641/g.330840 Transcript_132641/m.330840 type:complete len:246 (+) Transcript_132641:1045-1782(+)